MATRATGTDQAEWAELLHEGTMQSLAAVRLLLDAGLGSGSTESLEGAAREAVAQLDDEIARLRALVSEIKRLSAAA